MAVAFLPLTPQVIALSHQTLLSCTDSGWLCLVLLLLGESTGCGLHIQHTAFILEFNSDDKLLQKII